MRLQINYKEFDIQKEIEMKQVAIVILNWNGARMLETYLPGILREAEDVADVYVADNASTDGSVELLEREFPVCQRILLEKNWGFADGYNKALEQIEAPYYLLLNSDIEVTPGWLNPLLQWMENHPRTAACQPKILSLHQRDRFEYAGASGGYMDKYGYPFCRGRIFDVVEKDCGQYNRPCRVLWATGAALMIRSEDYWKAGGLDGRFFAHNEEIDLCWRLGLLGREVYCVPESVVYHLGGGTLPKSNPMKTYLNFRNNLTMLYKCLPDEELGKVMAVRCVLDYVAALKMLVVDRNWGDFCAVIKARKSFRKWKKQFTSVRKEIQRSRVQKHIAGILPASLLWQYHVKGKKTFAELARSMDSIAENPE